MVPIKYYGRYSCSMDNLTPLHYEVVSKLLINGTLNYSIAESSIGGGPPISVVHEGCGWYVMKHGILHVPRPCTY